MPSGCWTMAEQKELEKLRAQDQREDQSPQKGAAAQGEGHGGMAALAGAAKKVEGLLLGGTRKALTMVHGTAGGKSS